MLINSKMGTGTYLLDREHLPLRPEFEDNVVVMDASHPTSVEAGEKRESKGREGSTNFKNSRCLSYTPQDQEGST